MHDLDVLRAKSKTQDAKEWRGTVDVPMGEETVTFGHRLLTESEMTRLQQLISTEDASAYEDEQSEDYERVMELQSKPREELSEEEEAELKELLGEIREERGDAEDRFGEEAVEEILALGKAVVKPSPEDVNKVWELPPSEQKEVLGETPSNREDIEAVLTADAEQAVTNTVYPVKIRIGMKAISETKNVWGNGLQSLS